jgi:hypothetical protein
MKSSSRGCRAIYIQPGYNTTPRAGSSLSAYDVVFARQPRMPRSALLPPPTTVAGNAPEDLFEINVQQVQPSGGMERATTDQPRENQR